MEFKATIVRECITIHNQLRRRGAKFTQVRDALLEKQGQQISLRSHIFNNYVQIAASAFTVSDAADQLLAEKARLLLENVIPRLYQWFAEESVDTVLNTRLSCDRAKEPPRKKTAAFETNLPNCKRGKNKNCRVEEVLREEGPALMRSLDSHLEKSEQLRRAAGVIADVMRDAKADLSHGDCRNAGDCLIALEAKGKATHSLSSNAREWEPLSVALGFTFVRIAYPEEKTV